MRELPPDNYTRRKNYLKECLRAVPLARVAAQTSLFPEYYIWSWRRELNPRPSDYKSDALPTELRQQVEASPSRHNTSLS
jgi:hypothetical protein